MNVYEFFLNEKNEGSINCYYGGVKDQEAHVNIYIGPRAQSKEEPLLGYGKNPPQPWM